MNILRLIRRAYEADTPPPSVDPTPEPVAEASEGQELAGTGPSDPSDRVATLEAELKRARDEAASRRVALREAKAESDEFRKGLAKALGVDVEGKPDPDAMGSQIETLRQENRSLKVSQAFRDVAKKLGADEALSWAVLKSENVVSSLDVESDEALRGSLEEYLTKALEDNPKLKAGPGVPPRSGTDISGGTGTKTFTREELSRMTPDEIDANWSTISEQMKAGTVR